MTDTLPTPGPLIPPISPLAPDDVSGLRVLVGLGRNGFAAFPGRCMREPVIRLQVPGRALVIVCAPDAVRHVLQSHEADYVRLPAAQRILRPIVGRGMLVSQGEAWRRQRRIMAPAFTPRTIPVLATHIARCAEATCARLEAGDGEVDLLAEMQRLALDIASTSMFSLEADAFGADLRRMVSHYLATSGRPAPEDFLLPFGLPTPLAFRRALFRRRWKRLIGTVIATRRSQGGARATDAPRDLFDLMAAAHGEGSQDLLADEVATMIVAGHETTALALFWACLLLARSSNWQEALAEEAAPLDLSPEGAAASLPLLRQTRAVVQEVLRLYPPAFMAAQLARAGHEVCGVDIPRGAMVMIPFFLLHRLPAIWYEPDRFDPARFLEGQPDRFAYLPFGAGPHVCIGAQLAMTEAVLVLARLVQGSRITVAPGRSVLPVATLTTRPDHAPAFTLRRRERRTG
jgi:cytochrome P450